MVGIAETGVEERTPNVYLFPTSFSSQAEVGDLAKSLGLMMERSKGKVAILLQMGESRGAHGETSDLIFDTVYLRRNSGTAAFINRFSNRSWAGAILQFLMDAREKGVDVIPMNLGFESEDTKVRDAELDKQGIAAHHAMVTAGQFAEALLRAEEVLYVHKEKDTPKEISIQASIISHLRKGYTNLLVILDEQHARYVDKILRLKGYNSSVSDRQIADVRETIEEGIFGAAYHAARKSGTSREQDLAISRYLLLELIKMRINNIGSTEAARELFDDLKGHKRLQESPRPTAVVQSGDRRPIRSR